MKNISVGSNKAREYFLTEADSQKVLDSCPDAAWRLIFALARYAGFRCPSEHLALTWGDVDWVKGRLRVDSPKTGLRECPIFPELRPYLDDAYALAGAEAAFNVNAPVIARYLDSRTNLRSYFNRIIKRAGLTPWPKLFQNLRATRETELVRRFPIHVVCAWLGNSPRVAQKHYLQVTDSDFAKATGVETKAAPTSPEMPCTEMHSGTRPNENGREIDISADSSLVSNTPGRTRTCDRRIRNPLLYPTELRALNR
jgi:integrase